MVDVERSFDDYYYPIPGMEEEWCPADPPEADAAAPKSENGVGGEDEEGSTEEDQSEADSPRADGEMGESGDPPSDSEGVAGEDPPEADTAKEEEEKEHPCRWQHVHFDAGPQVMDGGKGTISPEPTDNSGSFWRSRTKFYLWELFPIPPSLRSSTRPIRILSKPMLVFPRPKNCLTSRGRWGRTRSRPSFWMTEVAMRRGCFSLPAICLFTAGPMFWSRGPVIFLKSTLLFRKLFSVKIKLKVCCLCCTGKIFRSRERPWSS